MFALIVIFVIIFSIFRMWGLLYYGEDRIKVFSNGSESGFVHYWHLVIDRYGIPFGEVCVSFFYAIYARCTFLNVAIFFLKYVPTGLYMYKFLTNIYRSSRERIKQKRMELEDIKLQIQIVNNKLCVQDAEYTEGNKRLHREAERLWLVRARVRDIIAANDALRRAVEGLDLERNMSFQDVSEQDQEFVVEMLKALKFESVSFSEQQNDKLNCAEHVDSEISEYSSLSDIDIKQDCRVRIVKVTNVYKVAYLKNFIKQKRLRRAHKHALLKKKMESIQKVFEDWQKSLSMVINNRLTILKMESHMDVASQEAMGDYSKPTLLSTDSDPDLKSNNEMPLDEYCPNWTPNSYKSYCYNLEEPSESTAGREYSETQDFSDVKYSLQLVRSTECIDGTCQKLYMLPEETNSQVAIEEVAEM